MWNAGEEAIHEDTQAAGPEQRLCNANTWSIQKISYVLLGRLFDQRIPNNKILGLYKPIVESEMCSLYLVITHLSNLLKI